MTCSMGTSSAARMVKLASFFTLVSTLAGSIGFHARSTHAHAHTGTYLDNIQTCLSLVEAPARGY